MKPFHLSFAVPNLEQAKNFYTQILGCSIGRDTGAWIDIIFFGHQVTIHQESDSMKAQPIDHFGPILEKQTWLDILERCKSNNIEFVMQPTIKDEGCDDESGKFIVLDPARNVIEFKFYNNFNKTLEN